MKEVNEIVMVFYEDKGLVSAPKMPVGGKIHLLKGSDLINVTYRTGLENSQDLTVLISNLNPPLDWAINS